MRNNEKTKSKKSIVYICIALALVIVACLSLMVGGVFGAEQSEEQGSEPAPTAADYLNGDYAQIDENGNVFTDEPVFVLRLAETINGEAVTSVSENCLKGCEKISAVIIPSTITEIGANAFADCPNLVAIIFEGRADLTGITLGENWNGGAPVLFGQSAQNSSAETAQPTGEPQPEQITEQDAEEQIENQTECAE